VTIATAGKATSTITTTTSDGIMATAVIVITMTNAKGNGRIRLLLIAKTRHSSHAWCTGQRASTPPKIATRTPRRINVKFKTKNVSRRRITMTRATQVTTTSCAFALIYRSQVRTRRQPLARAKKITRMRIIIFGSVKK
jgi:hypothetical protein